VHRQEHPRASATACIAMADARMRRSRSGERRQSKFGGSVGCSAPWIWTGQTAYRAGWSTPPKLVPEEWRREPRGARAGHAHCNPRLMKAPSLPIVSLHSCVGVAISARHHEADKRTPSVGTFVGSNWTLVESHHIIRQLHLVLASRRGFEPLLVP
jgi:hypothetical protein